MWKSVKTSGTASPGKEVTSKHDEADGLPGKVFGPGVTVGRLFKFQPVCALGPLAYFRWVIDDKLSLDVLPPPGWSQSQRPIFCFLMLSTAVFHFALQTLLKPLLSSFESPLM